MDDCCKNNACEAKEDKDGKKEGGCEDCACKVEQKLEEGQCCGGGCCG